MIIKKSYFLSEIERESVEQALLEKGHQLEDILSLDDEEIIHIYQKYMVEALIDI